MVRSLSSPTFADTVAVKRKSTIRIVHGKKNNSKALGMKFRALPKSTRAQKKKDSAPYLKLDPEGVIGKSTAHALKRALDTHAFQFFALPLQKISKLDFFAPTPPMPRKIKTDKFRISKALHEAKKMHSYMSMRSKLCQLGTAKLKELALGAGLTKGLLRNMTKAQIASKLWEEVEIAEEGKPPNLSTTEMINILKEHKVKMSSMDLKSLFLRLSHSTLLTIAFSKRIKVEDHMLEGSKEAKTALLDAIWKAKDLYLHNLNCYRAKRLIQDSKPRTTLKGILSYLTLREKLFDDLGMATIRSLRFKLEPYDFCCEELFCLGVRDNKWLLFCAIPTCTETIVKKRGTIVTF